MESEVRDQSYGTREDGVGDRAQRLYAPRHAVRITTIIKESSDSEHGEHGDLLDHLGHDHLVPVLDF